MWWPGKKAGRLAWMIGVTGTQRVGGEPMADAPAALIRANSVLPARREPVRLQTADGLCLVGELALPADVDPVATIVMVHPLPTHGGMMDSHLLRKASWRLPALADIAVLRFNTRGTTSASGTSEGEFDGGQAEGLDLAAAVDFVAERALPVPWLVGWSFGTDVILKHPNVGSVVGAILISPPLRFSLESDLEAWAETGRPLVALIPELDDYLRPAEAAQRFTAIPAAQLLTGSGAKHLWVGEPSVQFVLNEIVRAVNPRYFEQHPVGLPDEWDGPMERWTDL